MLTPLERLILTDPDQFEGDAHLTVNQTFRSLIDQNLLYYSTEYGWQLTDAGRAALAREPIGERTPAASEPAATQHETVWLNEDVPLNRRAAPGRPCWFRTERTADWQPGRWHCWSQDSVETEYGPEHNPVAIVEDPAGRVYIVRASMVHFGDPLRPAGVPGDGLAAAPAGNPPDPLVDAAQGKPAARTLLEAIAAARGSNEPPTERIAFAAGAIPAPEPRKENAAG